MKIIIVLAMHGTPPRDFPREELAEFFRLHSHIGEDKSRVSGQDRYSFLNNKMRNWPRTDQNDPFHAASQELAAHLSKVLGYEVVVGYNEFCAPSLEEALQSAADNDISKIIVATPMMTRGGEHSEKDIPVKIGEFRKRHPQIEITYAWPFDSVQVAKFLTEQISRFI